MVQLGDEDELDPYDLLDEPKEDQIVNVIAPTSSTVLKRKNPSGREPRATAPSLKKAPQQPLMDSMDSWQARAESPLAIAPPEEKVISPAQLMPPSVKRQPNPVKAAAPRLKAPSGPESRAPGRNAPGLTPILKDDRPRIQPY